MGGWRGEKEEVEKRRRNGENHVVEKRTETTHVSFPSSRSSLNCAFNSLSASSRLEEPSCTRGEIPSSLKSTRSIADGFHAHRRRAPCEGNAVGSGGSEEEGFTFCVFPFDRSSAAAVRLPAQ